MSEIEKLDFKEAFIDGSKKSEASICRFAPSPTGFLHVGNARAAIINYLYAKKTNGKFYLRLDNTDLERSKDIYEEQIIKDLEWLGIKYDNVFKQIDRIKYYESAKQFLIKEGFLYECYESEEELNIQRKSQISSGIPPIYNRNSLYLTDEQKNDYKSKGIKPYYRFLLNEEEIVWNDKIKGRISYKGKFASDPVLYRDNDMPTYTFCSVVDDIIMNITDIIRGEDHLTNTAIQIQIFKALKAAIPNFSHLALISSTEGKISKRVGGFDIKSLKEDGFEPITILNLLSQVGSSKSLKIYPKIEEIIENFDISNYSKSATKYNIEELTNINEKILKNLEYNDVKARLNLTETKNPEQLFNLVKNNIIYLKELYEWEEIFKDNFKYQNAEVDKIFLTQCIKFLPKNTRNDDTWENWLEKIKENTDRKGKEIFLPIRLALTGKDKGPEMKDLIKYLDKDEIIRRLT